MPRLAAPPLPVPSHNLLRFLRSQTDGLLSFDAASATTCRTSRVVPSAHGPLGPRALTCKAKTLALPPGRRSFCTSNLRPQRTEGDGSRNFIFDMNKILPRVFRRQRGSTSRGTQEGQYPDEDRPNAYPRATKPTWQEKLGWGGVKSLGSDMGGPGSSDDCGPDNNFTFGSRRAQLMRAPMDPRLRCTEVDENGEVILVDGEYKKSELIAKYGLLPRDLRKIDSSNLPHILVRPSAILINLLHLRVLIKSDRVLLFDVFGSKTSYNQSAFMYDLQGRLRQKQPAGSNAVLPYEFRALEAVLISVTSALEADLLTVREPVVRVLRELEDDINRDRLRILLVLSKKVSTFEQKAKLVRDAIDELLEADDDLAAMYLTEKRHDLYRGVDDHTEVEMLLESYHKICDEVVQEASSLVSSIRNTEEIIRAILDANRNSLMLLDLKFSIGTLGLAMGTFLAGLYGMNLENFIEETNWGFAGVTTFSIFFSLLVCRYGLVKLRKVQRVKMHGTDGGTTSSWFRENVQTIEQGNAPGLGGNMGSIDKFRRIKNKSNNTSSNPGKWI
ncbi:magnesium ion transporter [Pyricularia oryzae]|uniref:Magnesium transporter n=4 Tax=Pyricularia TaxID=48558 RepID=A0ABQ8P062_PYRGI|nr:inner membrane magnesium transporter MRS2 [Pyricularia oryzae 70-15]ELQ36153.1 inner membrane magnesium transporter MRS2 [Pyricularia oryzae Y34]KAH8838300.1 magnesium ion transporter [Pyricularia oryzae]KAI6304327.1 magnesium ion transporter [Pyricularia grisea]EHA46242.1 inner membrane magnesium transporter MRS2 [Pyricularia oryzae 70-15]KAH9436966.1 magnesium ion transporter [Pyricularia oryzae]